MTFTAIGAVCMISAIISHGKIINPGGEKKNGQGKITGDNQ